MGRPDGAFIAALLERGVSRRSFMKFCAAMTATLALPAAYAPRVAAAVAASPRLPVVWLRGQGCGGDGEALLRVTNPSIGDLLLQFLSIDY
ncbi:MAG TPA: twin-arginine translocation signal domain-containing protein, partial [Candidatus Binatus sp.]|nr:twin-arginine translocation signal domain-containing protein [Candidatus Binatus sp.]